MSVSFEALKKIMLNGLSKIGLVNTSGTAINPATEDTLSDLNTKVQSFAQSTNNELFVSVKPDYSIDLTFWSQVPAPVVNTPLYNPQKEDVTGESIGTGDGTTTSFSHTFANKPVEPTYVSISYTIGGTAYTATDDGNGNISGTDLSGTVNYDTGALSLTFSTAPDSGTSITANYSYMVNGGFVKIDDVSEGYLMIALGGATSTIHIVPVTQPTGTDVYDLFEEEIVVQSPTFFVLPVKSYGSNINFMMWQDSYSGLVLAKVSGVFR